VVVVVVVVIHLWVFALVVVEERVFFKDTQ